jgi:hypothetical protein
LWRSNCVIWDLASSLNAALWLTLRGINLHPRLLVIRLRQFLAMAPGVSCPEHLRRFYSGVLVREAVLVLQRIVADYPGARECLPDHLPRLVEAAGIPQN